MILLPKIRIMNGVLQLEYQLDACGFSSHAIKLNDKLHSISDSNNKKGGGVRGWKKKKGEKMRRIKSSKYRSSLIFRRLRFMEKT